MLSKNTKQLLKRAFNEIQINLENNYKDLAITARKDAEKLIEDLQSSGELKGRDYEKYHRILQEYTEKMKNYHH